MPYDLPREKARLLTQEVPEPVKVRVEPVQAPTIQAGNVPAEVKVLDAKVGEVNWMDKLKAYYHTVITVLGAILVVLNEMTPITDALPEGGKHAVTGVILFLTGLFNALKSNEVWVQKL